MGQGHSCAKKRRGLVDDLVEADGGKIGELHLDDRPHSFDGRADGGPTIASSLMGESSTRPGKFLGQIFRGLERAAERADILPVNKHARVVAQGAWPALRGWLRGR
jgi:hypothetical protein